ncbi:MAG: hypothetical protein IKV15_10760 [Bacteroidaceae bacterium]|nr:hypothetical protein [Bacteroidaceae bacterium]
MKKITLLAMSFFAALFVNAQNGVEVTHLLTNPDFEEGSTGWTLAGGGGSTIATAANYEYSGTTFMESWTAAPNTLSDRDWSQTIEVPNGIYVVRALAHAILQSDAGVVPSGVCIYANKDEVPVVTTTTNPPTEYSVSTIVTDGRLKVGYRLVSCNINWAAWDNVRIFQYIADTEDEAKLMWLKDELETLRTASEVLLSSHMQMALADNLAAKLDAIAEVATLAEAEALMADIKALMEEAELSIEAYEHLAAAIAAAQVELDRDLSQGADDLEEAIAAAEEYLENAAGTVAEVEAYIVQLNDDVFTYQMLNADGTIEFPVTDKYITNPTLRKDNHGWKGSSPGLEHEVMEFYDCDFDMYQTLTDIPNGMYKVYVQGFYRTGGNDGGAAYQDGSEVISAELYANNASVPLTSLYKYTASGMGVTNSQVLNDYVNMRVSTNEAFNLINPETEKGYYDDNELIVVVQDNTLTIGLRNSGHSGSSWCAFRDFKLGYYGNFPAVVLRINAENAQAWLDENEAILPATAVVELEDAIAEALDYTDPGDFEDEVVNEQMAIFDAVFASVKNVVTLMKQLKSMTTLAEELMTREYPGLDALAAAYEVASDYAEDAAAVEPAEGQTTEQLYIDVVAAFQAAINAYYESQVASKETPADYTHLLPNPNFEQKGDWTWSVIGGGTDQWNGGCRPNEDGGANRQGVNLWGWGLSSVDVHQELTNLPNGLYKVSAELITQGGYATDQHVYAVGVAKTTSKALEVEGWDSYEWEELTTEEYAVVLDGKLTIGAASSLGGSNSEGWFQATNFKLYYYGEASNEDLQAAWEASLARANEYVKTMLPGDSKDVAAAIAAATPLATEGKYTDACQALNPVVAAADSVYNVTKNFYTGNYQTMSDLGVDLDETVNAASLQVIAAALSFADATLKAEDATHKLLEPTNAKLAGYVSYVTYLIEAENTLASMKGVKEEYITTVKEQVIDLQVADLVAKFRTADDCADLLAKLQKAMKSLEGTLLINLREGDLTEDLIVNPTIDGDASGWTTMGGGPTNKGEHYSGETENRYLDAWAPSGLKFTAIQEIIGLPDGTYELTAATRTDGDNAYVFAATQPLEADTAAWTASTQWAMFKNYGAYRGEIWYNDSLAYVAADGAGEFPYYNARNGEGYGWSNITIPVEVTNHYLAIGITTNNALTGQAEFNGAWLGADDWKLVLVKKAATQSEFNPFAGIENLETVAPVQVGIYDLFGRRIETPTVSGIYIVNGKKVVIKK